MKNRPGINIEAYGRTGFSLCFVSNRCNRFVICVIRSVIFFLTKLFSMLNFSLANSWKGLRMPVEDRLIFLISKVFQKLIINLQKAFSESGIEVTPIQVMLLFFLQKNDGSSLTQISQGLMLENPTVTGLVDRLEKSGYVKRSDHPEDRRVYLVNLTEKGNRVASKALPIVKRLNEEIKKGYSKEEIEGFKKVLVGAFNKF